MGKPDRQFPPRAALRQGCRIAVLVVAAASALPSAAQRLPGDVTLLPARQPLATIVAEPVAMMIAACDQDGDALVSRAELATCLTRSFAGTDIARKGSLGYIEYSDWALRWLGDRNALPSPFEIDTDGDNRITPAEVRVRFEAIFTRLDRDHDGSLTRAEVLTIGAGVGAAGDPLPGKRGKRRGGGEGRP